MKPENKKIAMYVGGAVVVGAVGFFVYSFFQKPIAVGSTTVTVNPDEETPQSTRVNPFTVLLNKGVPALNLPTYAWEQK